MRIKGILALFIALVVLGIAVAATATNTTDTATVAADDLGRKKIYEKTLIIHGVELRTGNSENMAVTSDVEVIVWSNMPLNKPDRKLLSDGKISGGIPGWENGAHIWEETAKLDLQKKGGPKYFVGINMPVDPKGDQFGNLNLEDYANATVGVMNALQKNYGAKKFETFYSHSQGCSVVAKTQMNLKERGSSLKKKFGVKNYEFVACAPIGRTASWFAMENLDIAGFANNFVGYDPTLGVYVKKMDYYNWSGMFFLNLSGVPYFPTPDQYTEGSVEAPFGATSQLTGWRLGDPAIGEPPFVYDPTHMKLDLPSELFNKENVKVDCMSQDGLVTLQECHAAGEFLTGRSNSVVEINDPGAVHSAIVTNPRMIFGLKKLPFMKTVPESEEELPEYPEEE